MLRVSLDLGFMPLPHNKFDRIIFCEQISRTGINSDQFLLENIIVTRRESTKSVFDPLKAFQIESQSTSSAGKFDLCS